LVGEYIQLFKVGKLYHVEKFEEIKERSICDVRKMTIWMKLRELRLLFIITFFFLKKLFININTTPVLFYLYFFDKRKWYSDFIYKQILTFYIH
jgi:hypothetical protein